MYDNGINIIKEIIIHNTLLIPRFARYDTPDKIIGCNTYIPKEKSPRLDQISDRENTVSRYVIKIPKQITDNSVNNIVVKGVICKREVIRWIVSLQSV
jgi:molecular chaperone DnaK (HSP70)